MIHLVVLADALEVLRTEGFGVIGEELLSADTKIDKPPKSSSEKAGCFGSFAGGQDFSVGHSRGVVDTDVDVFPAGSSNPLTAVSMDPMSDPSNPGKRLGVDVEELSWELLLIAAYRLQAIQELQLAEAETGQDARHRCTGSSDSAGDLLGRESRMAELEDSLLNSSGCAVRNADGCRRTIFETWLPLLFCTFEAICNRSSRRLRTRERLPQQTNSLGGYDGQAKGVFEG